MNKTLITRSQMGVRCWSPTTPSGGVRLFAAISGQKRGDGQPARRQAHWPTDSSAAGVCTDSEIRPFTQTGEISSYFESADALIFCFAYREGLSETALGVAGARWPEVATGFMEDDGFGEDDFEEEEDFDLDEIEELEDIEGLDDAEEPGYEDDFDAFDEDDEDDDDDDH